MDQNNTGRQKGADKFPHISNVSSTTECTGLMPVMPGTEEEYESYMELFSLSIPVPPADPHDSPAQDRNKKLQSDDNGRKS